MRESQRRYGFERSASRGELAPRDELFEQLEVARGWASQRIIESPRSHPVPDRDANEVRAAHHGQHKMVRAVLLSQVEPDHGDEFVVRAWVSYPATADQVLGLALAWTPRAVYVEWEGNGTPRAWVWASAVERATANQAAL